jgi:divalent metal cation (Fe/Co/Zn/Cd) transporter
MTAGLPIRLVPNDVVVRRARLLAWLTIAWNATEGLVGLVAGVVAGSVALVGFGLDSVVEVFSGAVVLWQLHGVTEERERGALRLMAGSFFALAFYVGVQSLHDLASGREAATSAVGMVLAAAALGVMTLLTWAKRRVGRQLGNAVVMTDATQTAFCSYLSAVLLVGLGLNALLGWWWADPIAGLGIAALAVREGRDAWRGESCCEAC